MRAQGRTALGRISLASVLAIASFLLAVPKASHGQEGEQQPPPAERKKEPTNDGSAASAAASPSETPAPSTATAQGQAAGDSQQKPKTTADGPRVEVEQDSTILTNTDLVTVTVTVTDLYGRFVTGLSKSAFTILDEKTEQEILFFSDEDAPVSVGIVFDVSNSMGGEKIRRAREALARFIETSHKSDEYFLIGFNHRAQLLLDRTRDGDALRDKLTFVQTKGQTALYDAAYLGVEKVTRGTHQKRAILLISDGQDNSSRYTLSELRRMLKETDVIIYAVGIVSPNDDQMLGAGGRAILEELAALSGGKAFFPSTGIEMNDTFERIALELRTQYSIGYRPSDFTNDGKWRRIKIKVKPPRGFPRLFVRGREGYYAVTNPR